MSRVSEEQFRELFVVQKLIVKDIARKLGISLKSVKRLQKKYSIYRTKEEKVEIHKRQVMQKYGVDSYAKTKECKAKIKQTCLERYGVDWVCKTTEAKKKISQKVKAAAPIAQAKARQTCLKKYGVPYACQSDEVKQKISDTWSSGIPEQKRQQTFLDHYGVTNYTKTKQFRENHKLYMNGIGKEKAYETMKKNGSLVAYASKAEDKAYQMLLEHFPEDDIERQYRSEVYPFNCDFYIKSLDLYIEYQGGQYHGKHPFDPNSLEDQLRLKELKQKELENKSKQKTQFTRMIEVWVERDPYKREIAKKNNLNLLEVFSLVQLKRWLINYNKGD